MPLLTRLIFKRQAIVFLLSATTLVFVVWATQALRRIDLVTSEGQSIFSFFQLTLLFIPNYLGQIAPFALLLAMVITLNRLISDSEYPIIQSAGVSMLALFRPFLFFAALITLIVAILTLYIGPTSLALLRLEITKNRLDIVANISAPGQLISLSKDMVFYMGNKDTAGNFKEVFLHDSTNPDLHITFLANQAKLVKTSENAILLLQNGVMQRKANFNDNLSTINFDSYALDLSSLQAHDNNITFKIKEIPLNQLLEAIQGGHRETITPESARQELHNRIYQIFLPLAFAIISFFTMGNIASYRTARSKIILITISICLAYRILSFYWQQHYINSMAGTIAFYGVIIAIPAVIFLYRCYDSLKYFSIIKASLKH